MTAVEDRQSALDANWCAAGHGDELARLRQRVEDLEFTVTEYRGQMSQIFGSASWKLTSPVRGAAARYRTAKVRARRAAKRIKSGKSNRDDHKVLTAGLFMPNLTDLPETSPLRQRIDVNTLRRPADADDPPHRPEGDPTVLVVAHVHYPELWGDIDDRLSRMPCAFDLIVTVTEGTAEQAIPTIMGKHPKARIELVANKGRDWAPMVMLANRGLLSGYEAVAKVHTKKSEHRIDGDGWRIALLDGILESPEQIQRIIDLLQEDRSVGLVVPTRHVSGTEHWGSNQGIIEALAYRLPMAFDPDELRFPAGSMFWCRPWLLERIADLDIGDEHFEPEAGQYDATTAHALERLMGIYSTVGGMDIVEAMDVKQRLTNYRKNPQVRPNIYAFYLPQYHQCPENDEFWGEGFTDWDNVKKAKPLFEGHRQPILPNDGVGFYDLSESENLREHAARARAMGVEGLIFYHYWFNGHRVLERPMQNLLDNPDIDLPFALCWANEPWTRRWDGLAQDVLIPQSFPAGWETRFYEDIRPALDDRRYVTIDGRSLLLVYRLDLIPDLATAINTWRYLAKKDGFPGLHVLGVQPSRDFGAVSEDGVALLDGIVAFPPGSAVDLVSILDLIPNGAKELSGDVFSYDSAADSPAPSHGFKHRVPVFPTVFPGWDNTARRGVAAHVFHGSNRLTFRRWLQRASRFNPPGQPNLVFLNAWNEWAEGACIEDVGIPDLYRSAVALRAAPIATVEAIDGPRRPYSTWLAPSVGSSEDVPGIESIGHFASLPSDVPSIVAVVHVHYSDLWGEIAQRLLMIDEPFALWVSLTTHAHALAPIVLETFPHARFVFPDGRGRDIAPLVMLAEDGLLDDYDLVLKLHTKRSPHREDGEQWRLHLLDSLLPSCAGISTITRTMREDAKIGVCAADDCLGGPESWGDNLERVGSLAARRGWAIDPGNLQFAAGSMFWARGDVIRDLRGFDIKYFEFEPELGQLDGTTAHAVERLIGITAQQAGAEVVSVSDVRVRPATPTGGLA